MDRRHIGHLVRRIAEHLQAHGQRGAGDRFSGQGMIALAGLQALFQHDAGALAGGEQHGRRLRMVVQTPLGPVVHDHGEVKIVRADAPPIPGLWR